MNFPEDDEALLGRYHDFDRSIESKYETIVHQEKVHIAAATGLGFMYFPRLMCIAFAQQCGGLAYDSQEYALPGHLKPMANTYFNEREYKYSWLPVRILWAACQGDLPQILPGKQMANWSGGNVLIPGIRHSGDWLAPSRF
ncbi:hypothetical protein B0J17DRAFT_633818 [Rhizoctonia solani]|nr:hypothetical protein B0J17DRAFT_633818 [Rhizoctonia solani]